MEAEIRKWGNSKAIIIPSDEIERFGLDIGDKIDFSITKKEEIDGFGVLKGKKLKPFVRDHRFLDRELS